MAEKKERDYDLNYRELWSVTLFSEFFFYHFTEIALSAYI